MRLSGIIVAAALPFAACSHATKAMKAEAPPPTPEPVVATAFQAPAQPSVRSCSSDDQCTANELCVLAQCTAITPGLAECRATTHFDFDRSDIHPEDMPKLQRVARCMRALPTERTLVEGNCDERGTVQYNIALGFRRTHAVGKYVADLGIPSGRLPEVSYGKEQPVCTESTESCWELNRRADVTPGGSPRTSRR